MADEDDEDGGGMEEERVCPEGAPEWVVTFGDMMSLLLTFFILLLSFSSMDTIRFKEMAGTIKKGFGVKSKDQDVVIPKATDVIAPVTRVEYNARKVLEKLRRRLEPPASKRKTAKVDVEVFETYRGVVVLFPAEEVFQPGTDRLRAGVLPLLDHVAMEARDHLADGFELAVEVRSPEGVALAPQFADVWSLTAAQAVAVANHVRASGGLDPGAVVPVGRGPAPPTQRPGNPERKTVGSTVEFVFLSREMKPQN